MRDDLHKRATLPPKVSKLLRMASREADRLQGDLLSRCAADALRAELARDVDPSFMRRLRDHHAAPNFLGISTTGFAVGGSIQADIRACLDDGIPPNEALQEALTRHADSFRREVKAVLLVDRSWEEGVAYRAFCEALTAGVERVAGEALSDDSQPSTKPRLSLNHNLLAGFGKPSR